MIIIKVRIVFIFREERERIMIRIMWGEGVGEMGVLGIGNILFFYLFVVIDVCFIYIY